jgi:hypothetical protein
MSKFIDATLFRFAQDAFVVDMLTNTLGLSTVFNMTFELTDIELQSIAVAAILPRSYKVPVFETIRTNGTDERILPDAQRVKKQWQAPRSGRLDWIDVAFKASVTTKMKTLVAPLKSVTSQMLEQKLGSVTSLADLRAKLETLYAPSVVDDLLKRLRISTLADFKRRQHLLLELVGAEPPPFDPQDPANVRNYEISVCVKISDGFDVAAALQSAKLCRSILEHETIPEQLDGIERTMPYTFVTVFPNAAVTDDSIPGQTAAEAKSAASTLFAAERMFAHFIP